MKRPVVVTALLLVGCTSNNPGILWLAPYEMETKVQLIDHEPTPF